MATQIKITNKDIEHARKLHNRLHYNSDEVSVTEAKSMRYKANVEKLAKSINRILSLYTGK